MYIFQCIFFNVYFFNRPFAGAAGPKFHISTLGVIYIRIYLIYCYYQETLIYSLIICSVYLCTWLTKPYENKT